MPGFCEQCNELPDSMKCEKYLYQLSDCCRFLKKETAAGTLD